MSSMMKQQARAVLLDRW